MALFAWFVRQAPVVLRHGALFTGICSANLPFWTTPKIAMPLIGRVYFALCAVYCVMGKFDTHAYPIPFSHLVISPTSSWRVPVMIDKLYTLADFLFRQSRVRALLDWHTCRHRGGVILDWRLESIMSFQASYSLIK